MNESNGNDAVMKIFQSMPLYQREYIEAWVQLDEIKGRAIFDANMKDLLIKNMPPIEIVPNVTETTENKEQKVTSS